MDTSDKRIRSSSRKCGLVEHQKVLLISNRLMSMIATGDLKVNDNIGLSYLTGMLCGN
jgi:hypothetical protein